MSVERIRSSAVFVAAAFTAALACSTASGLEGKVTDMNGVALDGARVCYLLGGAEQLCAETDAEGRYELPKSQSDRIRIARDGYLPQVLAAVHHGKPIPLRAAAILRLWVEGVEGDIPEGSKAMLLHPTGRQTGPFSVNAGGLRVRGLQPGDYRVSVTVPGYRQDGAPDIRLDGGKETRVVVTLVRENGS